MADTVSTGSSVSSNWAGYRAATQDGNGFTRVAGSWTEPSADCSTSSGHASFWVGLGGSGAGDSGSDSLEQAGTAVDCDASGNATHTAWYELLPAAPVQLDLKVSAGDHMSSSVAVNGSAVTITVSDSTTGQSTTKNLTMPNQPDVSTAEWIAEAPSHCDNTSGCQPLTLANFGKVGFTNASATASGHTGTISDSAWTSQPVTLSPGGGVTDVSAGDSSSGGAQPTDLSSDGSSFSVSYVGRRRRARRRPGLTRPPAATATTRAPVATAQAATATTRAPVATAQAATATTRVQVGTATARARSGSIPPRRPPYWRSSDPSHASTPHGVGEPVDSTGAGAGGVKGGLWRGPRARPMRENLPCRTLPPRSITRCSPGCGR